VCKNAARSFRCAALLMAVTTCSSSVGAAERHCVIMLEAAAVTRTMRDMGLTRIRSATAFNTEAELK
jgi:hypothetical protein